MAKQVYQIDVLMPDNTTHKIVKAQLTDDEAALVKAFALQATALKVGCNSITVTVDSVTVPMTLADLNTWLNDKVPMGDRKHQVVLDKAATIHK